MKILRCLMLCAAACAWFMAYAGSAQAHRVNVFAYVEGGMVKVECGFSKSNPVKAGELSIQDAASGAVYLTGRTDDNGLFAFPIPEAALKAGTGLRIVLKAGEGHQNEWTVPAELLRESSSAPVRAPAPPVPVEPGGAEAAAPTATGCDAEAMAGIVEQAVERKIAPLRQMLLEHTMQGPGLTEILGGIGYIFGLVGIAAFFMSKRR